MGTEPGACHHCHTGLCPVGITTQDEDLIARLPVDEAADHVAGFLNSMTQEMQMFARACGKNDVHDLEPEDLRAMTIEASAITGIPLVGTDFAFRPESFADAIMRAMTAQTDKRPLTRPEGAPLTVSFHPVLPQLRPPRRRRVRLRRRGDQPRHLVRGRARAVPYLYFRTQHRRRPARVVVPLLRLPRVVPGRAQHHPQRGAAGGAAGRADRSGAGRERAAAGAATGRADRPLAARSPSSGRAARSPATPATPSPRRCTPPACASSRARSSTTARAA